MCKSITERPVSLNRALTAVEDALTQFADRDSYDRIKWTPVESLREKPLSCTIATMGQLRALLQPALQSPTITVTHSTFAPYRSILEYTDRKHTSRYIMLAQDTIRDFGTNQHCAINYHLAYYLATALGSNHTPDFAINSFDASMAAYIRCKVQEPQPENCEGIFSDFLITNKEPLTQVTNFMSWCEDRIKTDQPPTKSQEGCMRSLRGSVDGVRDLILHGVENHADLSKERRRTLRSEIQNIPTPRKEIKTLQDARDGYANIAQTVSALFQTTAGRYYFWALRPQLSYSCKIVTDPAQRFTNPNIETLECQYRGYTARRDFEVELQRSTDDISQK